MRILPTKSHDIFIPVDTRHDVAEREFASSVLSVRQASTVFTSYDPPLTDSTVTSHREENEERLEARAPELKTSNILAKEECWDTASLTDDTGSLSDDTGSLTDVNEDFNTEWLTDEEYEDSESNSSVGIERKFNRENIDLDGLKTDGSKRLDFSKYVFDDMMKVYSPEFRALIEKYNNYQYSTVEEYKQAKNYPSGKDIRPTFFEPNGENLAAHGTNLETLLLASINCNLQITPGIKNFKLQGGQHKSGESARTGTTHLNARAVSTVALGTITSHFDDVKRYAEHSASTFLTRDKNSINSIPVVIIGDGVKKIPVRSDISNEVGYKRLNTRIVAFKNEEDKNIGIQWLRKIRDDFDVPEIDTLKFCYFKELRSYSQARKGGILNATLPSISSLWGRSESME